MIKKISIICVYAFVAMMVFASCNDEDDIKSFEEVETVQHGYFREVTDPNDVDHLFMHYIVNDTTKLFSRWCALMDNSISVFTAFKGHDELFYTYPFIAICKDGEILKWKDYTERFNELEYKGDIKLNPEKPYYMNVAKGRYLLPFIYGNDSHYYFSGLVYPTGITYATFLDGEIVNIDENKRYYTIYYKKKGKSILYNLETDEYLEKD